MGMDRYFQETLDSFFEVYFPYFQSITCIRRPRMARYYYRRSTTNRRPPSPPLLAQLLVVGKFRVVVSGISISRRYLERRDLVLPYVHLRSLCDKRISSVLYHSARRFSILTLLQKAKYTLSRGHTISITLLCSNSLSTKAAINSQFFSVYVISYVVSPYIILASGSIEQYSK